MIQSYPISRYLPAFRSIQPLFSALEQTLDDLAYPTRLVLEDETDAAYVLTLALPGFKKGEVDVEVRDDTLAVFASRKGTKTDHASDRHTVQRSITLPGDIDAAKIEARLEDGVLTLTLPKTAAAVPRKVDIK
jgi:HSP20 family protein